MDDRNNPVCTNTEFRSNNIFKFFLNFASGSGFFFSLIILALPGQWTVVPVCLYGERNEFVFIIAASNLTLVRSKFIKQIPVISAPALYNNFGSPALQHSNKRGQMS